MATSLLAAALRDAIDKCAAFEKAIDDAVVPVAHTARTAVEGLIRMVADLQSKSASIEQEFAPLRDVGDKLFIALKADDAPYGPDDLVSAKKLSGNFRVVARRFEIGEGEIVDDTCDVRPLLSPALQICVGITAIVLFIAGAVCAAIGVGMPSAACTTLSQWLGVASFVLSAVWLASIFMASPQPFRMTSRTGGSGWQYPVFATITLVVLALLAAGVLNGASLEFLKSVPGARGLITFLIAVGTIAIAVILTLASVVIDGDTEAVKERLSKGKEILTVLVGVLGTIVGFYFANNPDESLKMRINIVSTDRDVEVGKTFHLGAQATGGDLPYNITAILNATAVTDKDPKVKTATASVNPQGYITATFEIDESSEPGTLIYNIGAIDRTGKSATAQTEIKVVKKPTAPGQ